MTYCLHKLVCFRVGYKIKKGIPEDYFYKDRDSQIAAIEKTFEKSKEVVSFLCMIEKRPGGRVVSSSDFWSWSL